MEHNSKECDCSNHKNHEDQGCNCDHDHEDQACSCDQEQHSHGHHQEHDHQEPRKIYLTLTDGKNLECDVLDIFEVEDQSYIAILPSGSETAMLYGFVEDDQGPRLRNIEEDDEYKNASETFMERQEA